MAEASVVLYHGTDWESALDILNYGLNAEKLRHLQSSRATQLGFGWYLSDDVEIAWYFASLAPGLTDGAYTVIEMLMKRSDLETLMTEGSAIRRPIINVPFSGEQIWISPDAFAFVNERALFRPYTLAGRGVG